MRAAGWNMFFKRILVTESHMYTDSYRNAVWNNKKLLRYQQGESNG
jgi:hypothetical protein